MSWTRAGAHEERAQHVAWLDSRRLLSCGADCVARLWDTAAPGDGAAPLLALRGHGQRVSRVAAAGGGRLAVTASHDGTWRCWDLEREGESAGVQVRKNKGRCFF